MPTSTCPATPRGHSSPQAGHAFGWLVSTHPDGVRRKCDHLDSNVRSDMRLILSQPGYRRNVVQRLTPARRPATGGAAARVRELPSGRVFAQGRVAKNLVRPAFGGALMLAPA
ncbi:MAG: hypothetical protein JWO67_4246 [Streptosporangiaceae bacterium]|nr:hypothetical protein [Streptosporangiaceae bacterium]